MVFYFNNLLDVKDQQHRHIAQASVYEKGRFFDENPVPR